MLDLLVFSAAKVGVLCTNDQLEVMLEGRSLLGFWAVPSALGRGQVHIRSRRLGSRTASSVPKGVLMLTQSLSSTCLTPPLMWCSCSAVNCGLSSEAHRVHQDLLDVS